MLAGEMQVEEEHEQDTERQHRDGSHYIAGAGPAHLLDGPVQHAIGHRGEQIEIALRQHGAVDAAVLPDAVLIRMDDMQHIVFAVSDGVSELARFDVDGRVRRRHMELHVVVGGIPDALAVADEVGAVVPQHLKAHQGIPVHEVHHLREGIHGPHAQQAHGALPALHRRGNGDGVDDDLLQLRVAAAHHASTGAQTVDQMLRVVVGDHRFARHIDKAPALGHKHARHQLLVGGVPPDDLRHRVRAGGGQGADLRLDVVDLREADSFDGIEAVDLLIGDALQMHARDLPDVLFGLCVHMAVKCQECDGRQHKQEYHAAKDEQKGPLRVHRATSCAAFFCSCHSA